MSPQRFAVLAVLCGTLVINGWVAAELGRLGSPGTETARAPVAVDTPQATALAGRVSDSGIVGAALSDPRQMLQPATPPVPTASASAPDPMPASPIFEIAWTARVAAVLPDPGPVLPSATPPVPTASANTPGPVPDDVVAAAPPVEVAETENAALPDPGPVTPPVPTASASTPDPVPDGGAAAASPVEIAALASVGGTLPDPGPVPPPATPSEQTASASTPDPLPDDVAAAAPAVEVVEPASAGGALPDAGQVLPPATASEQTASASTSDPAQDDVAAAAPAVEVVALASVGGALPDHVLPPATPPVRLASASAPDPVQDDVAAAASPVEIVEPASVGAALPDPHEMLPPATPPVRLVSLFRPAPLEDPKPVVRRVETPNECLVAEICIDDYLWSLYEWTPKVDTNKVTARIKTTVTRKGKMRTVMKTFIRYVAADFTWKDPIAAQRAGMSLKDYVIGGMDRGFKLKLYRALRAMDDAGLMPGITSAFRDDYRQAIASGNKAASDSSYHGGSRRGGYGYGLAVDLVSVRGETRLQRWASTVELWKWIDANEHEFGVGRPYLQRDPPHVGPIDGKEYAAKRGGAKSKRAILTNRPRPAAVGDKQAMMNRATKAKSLKVGSI